MRERYPSLKLLAAPNSKQPWEAVFTARPDIMAHLLADVLKHTYAVPGRVGQRPMPKEENVDFQGMFWSEVNEMPLVDVLPKLMDAAGVSQRQLSQQSALSRTQVQRILDGEIAPDAGSLRGIADAVGVAPTYFLEYRKLMAVTAFAELLERYPGMATRVYRDYLEVRHD